LMQQQRQQTHETPITLPKEQPKSSEQTLSQ